MSWETRSPDGAVRVRFDIAQVGGVPGCPVYRVEHLGAPVVETSRLGLDFAGAAALVSHLEVVSVDRAEIDTAWSPPFGDRWTIPDRCTEMTVTLREAIAPHRRLTLTFRAYDEGAALRYALPAQGGLGPCTIGAERTEFRFPDGTLGYEEHGTEGEYERRPVAEIRAGCERPLTVEYPDGRFAALTEAGNLDHPRMLLSPRPGAPGTLVSDLSGPARCALPFAGPWRVFIVGRQAGDLLERNHLLLTLSEPCALADTAWIRPGKAIREVTLSTAGGKACVDFAAAHGLQYVEYDAGWYGPENDEASDARRVFPDPARIRNQPDHGGLDLAEVIRYARERGIGVLLYVNRRHIERQWAELLPLYAGWGVAGVKFGFVRVGAGEWTRWLHEAIRGAAEHHLVVDVHDEYRPTGISRTYPHLLTQEGIRGNEHMPTPRHNCTLPFTRCVAGAADYTVCYYTDRIQTTHAHQLALPVVIYSPLQFCFWYDRPAAYRGEPEVEFFERVPTVWDDTRVLDGEIGEYAVVARRSGAEWYVGCITNETPRRLEVDLSFLEGTQPYVAHIFGDGGEGRTGVAIRRCLVHRGAALGLALAAGGGAAIRLAPAGADDADRYSVLDAEV